jgi:hypothetical protein
LAGGAAAWAPKEAVILFSDLVSSRSMTPRSSHQIGGDRKLGRGWQNASNSRKRRQKAEEEAVEEKKEEK